MKNCVYILRNSDNRYYIGSTGNLTRRLQQHRGGSTKTTKRLKAYELVFAQQYATLAQARVIERKLKELKRKDYVEKIIRDGYIKMKPSSFPPSPSLTFGLRTDKHQYVNGMLAPRSSDGNRSVVGPSSFNG